MGTECVNKQQFTTWMVKVGFSDIHIVKRLFDVFDESRDGTLDFAECLHGQACAVGHSCHILGWPTCVSVSGPFGPRVRLINAAWP